MDFLSNLKSQLDEADLNSVLENLKLEKEILYSSFSNYNYSFCSNKSFLFIYLEQVATFLALSLSKLSNSGESNNFSDSFQVSFNFI
jgi:hypothetical protein